MNGTIIQSGTIQAKKRCNVVMIPGVATQKLQLFAHRDRRTTEEECDARKGCT